MKLKNITKTVQEINIPCLAPECGKGCFCVDIVTPLVEQLEDGTRGSRILERRLAGNITIRPGLTTEDLPDWVCDTPTVKRALPDKPAPLVA